DGATSADLLSGARPPDRNLCPAARRADPDGLSALLDRLGVFRALRGRTAPPLRRLGTGQRQPGRGVPKYCAAPAPAPHDRGVASARRAPDRGVALVSGRRGGAS